MTSWSVAGLVVLASALSYLMTWVARGIAPKLGFLDHPDGNRKLHTHATPLMGGVAVSTAVVVTVLSAPLFGLEASSGQDSILESNLMLVACVVLTCLLGLWDDKYPIRARNKAILQLIPALVFSSSGQAVEEISLFGMSVDMAAFSIPATMLWLVACTNAFNLIDGADGLASSQGIVAMATLGILALVGGNAGVAAMSFLITGSLIGFLVHNWPPARIYLGDAGSCTIGFLVGAISIQASQKTATGYVMLVPFVLLGIPCFDTLMAIVRRRLNRRGIMDPDRGHIHHRLFEQGFSHCQTLLVIASCSLILAISAVASFVWQNEIIALSTFASVVLILVLGRFFGYHEVQMLIFRFRTAWKSMRTTTTHVPSNLHVEDFESDENIILTTSANAIDADAKHAPYTRGAANREDERRAA